MPPLLRAFSRRDAILVLVGALTMHFFATVAPLTSRSVVAGAGVRDAEVESRVEFLPENNREPSAESLSPSHAPEEPTHTSAKSPEADSIVNINVPSAEAFEAEGQHPSNRIVDLSRLASLPETTIVEHFPGWTLFRDVYMANGTWLLLTSSPSEFPDIRYMTSTGLPAQNNNENIALREPTPQNMDIVSPEEAAERWGRHPATRRVWSVEGNTLLFNDPDQFLAHYYHFCAELLLGTWSFWTGAAYPNPPPPVHRAIFPHSSAAGWRDNPGFNSYFLRAAFPSITVEVDADWNDRVVATSASIDSGIQRAWHFPYLMLADRSAAFRGKLCGSQNQRTASESIDNLIAHSKLQDGGSWWRPVRNAVWRFAGVLVGDGGFSIDHLALDDGLLGSAWAPFEETEKIVITYISRQSSRRRLIPEDHEVLVKELKALVGRKNAEIEEMLPANGNAAKEWELNVVEAEKMSKDEQVRLVARTTILLGVHGNGLSHLILMPRTHVSAVIEMFYPGGFAHDYEWTTRALGMKHFGVWNDTFFGDDTPPVGYPVGFQGERIPVYGPNVANIIEKRIAGEL